MIGFQQHELLKKKEKFNSIIGKESYNKYVGYLFVLF